MSETSSHIGRKISRIRELRGMKQEFLAAELGISQQAVSKIEQSEKLEEGVLERISQVLGIPSDNIKHFSDEAVINILSSSLHDNSGSVNSNCSLTFNPVERLMEAIEENKKLYERLLASEREKVELLKGKRD
jgi:transcriptional regulator with XRE-family HTH domain